MFGASRPAFTLSSASYGSVSPTTSKRFFTFPGCPTPLFDSPYLTTQAPALQTVAASTVYSARVSEEAFLHLGSVQAAADVISEGLRRLGRDEPVIGWPDNLTEGPLRDVDENGALRGGWYQKLHGTAAEEEGTWFASPGIWDQVVSSSANVVIWHGDHPMDRLFALRACWHLRSEPERVFEVVIPPHLLRSGELGHPGGRSVAVRGPDIVAAEWERRRKVTDVSERAGLWEKLRDREGEWVRVLDGEDIVELPVTCFDGQLTAECGEGGWRASLSVVATLLATTTAGYDLIIWRLRQLVLDGILEARGPQNQVALPEELRRPVA